MAEHDATPPPDGFYWFERPNRDLEVVLVERGEISVIDGDDEQFRLESWPEGRYKLSVIEGRLLGRIPEPNSAARLTFPISEENGQPAAPPMIRTIAYPLDGSAPGGVDITHDEAAAMGLPAERPDYVHCVGFDDATPEASGGRRTWCGRGERPFFVGPGHAALNGMHQGRLVACPECVAAIAAALRNGHDGSAS